LPILQVPQEETNGIHARLHTTTNCKSWLDRIPITVASHETKIHLLRRD